MLSNNKGITIVVLVITVVVMLILSGIVIYSGMDVLKDAKIQNFTASINQIESAIDTEYFRYQNNSIDILPGEKITTSNTLNSEISSLIGSKLTNDNLTAYYYLNADAINSLELSNVEPMRYIVNYSTGEVIDTKGVEIDGNTYYTIDSLNS